IDQLLIERMLNHFNGVFYKAEEEDRLLEIFKSENLESVEMIKAPEALIRTNFKPFENLLPLNYVDACIDAMLPYIKEANVTIQLNDDTFKFASTLPGSIFQSNADSVSNDTLWWAFDLKDFMNDSYTIEAASIVYYPQRIQKAIVLGTLIILIVLFIIAKRKAIL
ncbi:MAG: hypothetical protein VYE41_01385, partial [Candidatus Neomarinimicrobiota bacterium]|nr:hypothetical protein [Candidatus Neomarinimicrobiota bacterium]MED5248308.1 hypothetical protein [Candidatus Neomarinimicrobiota bacterium]